MLTIVVPKTEYWDPVNEVFRYYDEEKVKMQHSLYSISKWESRHLKSFFLKKEKTTEEIFDYIKCMIVDEDIDQSIFDRFTEQNFNDINNYINSAMSATTFSSNETSKSSEILTTEMIYYLMIVYNIPSDYQYWHINRLLNLIRICEIKNKPSKKMSVNALARRNSELNAARRKKLHTKG